MATMGKPLEVAKIVIAAEYQATSHIQECKPSLGSLPAGESRSIGAKYRALAKVGRERALSHIKAWEENEKSKSLNKYNKVITEINAWENTKKANVEAKLKQDEEDLAKKRATYVEKMKNNIAQVHKNAEEQRAIAEAKKCKEFVKVEEVAAKCRARNHAPTSRLWCFGA